MHMQKLKKTLLFVVLSVLAIPSLGWKAQALSNPYFAEYELQRFDYVPIYTWDYGLHEQTAWNAAATGEYSWYNGTSTTTLWIPYPNPAINSGVWWYTVGGQANAINIEESYTLAVDAQPGETPGLAHLTVSYWYETITGAPTGQVGTTTTSGAMPGPRVTVTSPTRTKGSGVNVVKDE